MAGAPIFLLKLRLRLLELFTYGKFRPRISLMLDRALLDVEARCKN